MEDNKRKLYDALSAEYDLGTFEQFSADIQDAGKRKKLYDATINDYDFGDFDSFSNQLGFSVLQTVPEQNAFEGLKGMAESQGVTMPVDSTLPTENRNQDIFAGRENMARYADSAQNLRKAQAAYNMNPTAENAEQLDSAAMNFSNVETSRLDAEKEKRTKEELLAERKRLEDAKREAELRLRTRRGEIASPSGMYQMGMAPVTGNQATEITDPEMTKLYAAVNSYDNAIRSVDRKLSGEEPGFWEGVADATVRNPGFYTMGLTDMSDARGMLNIAQNGVEGREDELLADALYSKNAEQQDEDFGFLYRAGNMFGHSVPFMVQTAVTGGFSGASRAGANLAGRLGKKAAEGTIKKKIINAMGTTIDDVIEAGLIANTAGAGGTWANIAERKAGKINIKDGDYVFENGESWLGALYKGEVSSILELYTEKLGGHLEGKLSLTKGLDKIGASRVSNVLLAAKNSDLYKGASTVMHQFGLNGYLPEVLEEEANLVLNSLLVGDNSLSELYNPKTQLDIFGGMLLTVGTMQAIPGTIATAGYVKNQYQMSRADRRAADVFGEDWEAIKEALDNATNEKVAGIVAENLREDENHNKALLDYYKRMMIMRGYNIGTVKNETTPDIEEAYTDGFSQEPTGANALNAMTGYDIARQEVVRALGLAEDDDVDVFLNGRTAEDIAKGDTDVENAVKNYQLQKARMEGIQEKFQQTREQQYEESDRSIDKIANNGVVYSTTINGEQVYITGGTVVLDEQGFIDVNSSNNLFCLMPDGTKKPKSENDLREKISMQNAEDLKAAKRAEINDRWKAEFDAAEAQSVEQEKREAGIQTESAVVDNTTDNGTPTESEANVAPTGDNVTPVAPVENNEPVPVDPKQRKAEVLSRIPMKGKQRMWTEANPADVAEYISLLTEDPAKRIAVIDGYIAKVKAAQAKAEPIEALEMDEQVAFWNGIKEMLAPQENVTQTTETTEEVAPVEQPVAQEEVPVSEPVGNSEQLSSSEIPNNQSVAEGDAPGRSGVYADNQGNPVDADGKLIVDEVNSIDEITDEDFETPTRNVQLPAIPENVANAIGTNGRPVVIKKNVFEKNGNTHVELEPEDSRNILRSALYNPNLVGSTQPIRRPDYKVAIRTGEQNAVVILDVYQEKDFVEIVGWRMVNEKGLAKMQRQAEREGGQFLILSPNDGSAAALSALPLGLSSASEGTAQDVNSQENTQKSGEIAENGGENAVPEWLNKVPDDGRNFFVYVKFAGENKYQAIDLGKGETVGRLVRATMLQKEQLQALVDKLPSVLLEDAEFQIRDAKGNIYYNSGKVAAENEAPVTSETTLRRKLADQEQSATNPSGNRLVTDERYAELRERMRKKLGGQMNIGIDPEILAIGTEMAVYHIEKGARKFADFAKGMIADLGDAIRPYLKAFYNGARELPEIEEAGLTKDMTPYEEVKIFDVANFDKPTVDAMATAETVTREAEVAKDVETVKAPKKSESAEGKKLRKASQEDLEGNPVVYYKGEKHRILMLIHRGEQTTGGRFTKPEITRVYLENMQDVKVDDLYVEDTRENVGESGDNSVPSQQTPVNNLNENNDGREEIAAADNSGARLEREELSDTEQVGTGTPVQNTARNSRRKRRNAGVGSSELGNGPQYDVNRNYTNEEIETIVSSVTGIVDGKVVITGEVTDDIKAIVRGYESGGIAKKGRGILDEYYTDGKIVDAVNMLIAPYFDKSTPVRVLEPSVGIGNFIEAVNDIPTSEVVAFEINETTARIAKILYPDVDVNLRSFETEFIDESGNKKPMPQKYSLVIGNPPYGSHRGLYKGLGEESKIARYEDYFVKRSLDVLDEGGVLAMVLPSSWMDRHTKFGGYTIERAYRLPSGAFEATQVGTDIVILKKDSFVPVAEHAPYFEQFPERVLGEVKQRKGRYGRLEEYVEGDIDAAIEAIKKENAEQLADLLDIEKNNDALNDIESAVDETGSPEKAVAIVKDAQESEKADKKPAKKPSGKQGKYKVELNRGVETVPTSAQFTHEFSEGEVEAFADTDYEGALSNPAKHRRYANYIGGQAIHDFYYAEGDIYSKLAQLEQEKDYIVENYGVEQYEKQKALLESVLPKQKSLEEITISPNTTFVKNLNILTEGGRVSLKDMFVDFLRKLPRQAFGNSSPWEVVGYINNEQVHGTDKQRNQLIRERRKRVANDLFNKFLSDELSDNAKKQVVAAFNREYNSTYRPDYSKVPMFSTINRDFKGKPLKLTSVQLAGIGRMTVKGVGVLAHEVGFGKTLSGILAMHEAMTRGFAKKPLIVVPNDNILKQWVETIGEVLPNATVNTLGNLGAGYDLTDFKVNEGEFTIITYEGLKAMSFSDGTYNHLASKFSYITEDLNKHQSERDIQKRLEKTKELKGKMKRGTKSSYMFEDFGFDWLTVDEVHNANHIVSKVRLDKSVASDFRSQSQRTSDLGLKTWLAAQYIQEENNGRNVLLLSATPFTNKPLEYYSILSLVGNDMLERKGFFNVDQFFATFMEADNELEIGANGRPTQKTNVRRFRNNGLFQQLLSEFIDIKGEEDNPELVRPERLNKEYKIAQNELTAEAMAAAQELLSDNDTVLQGIGHARAAAFSPYATSLLGVQPKNHKEFVKNSPKIDATIKMIEQNIKDRPDAGQIVYSEVGVEFFPLIRDYLVKESGLKPNEVRIITGATSNNERVNIQSEFNDGKVKVVIGSPAIKEGLNLQGNTTDMYILSLPWNFTQLRQIEGRGWRQGNKWENIRINYMLTNDSVDVFMLQRLQLKQGLYNEAMKSGAESLDVSDIDTAELKTALITDPAVRAEIVTVQERAKLQQEKTQIEADLSFVMRKYEAYNKLVEKLGSQKNTIKMYREWAKKGDEYWAQRIPREEAQLANIENEIEEEKQSLLKKGVNVDDIVSQTEQAQNAIAAIQEKIDNLKEFQEELTQKFREESEAKAKEQGDLVSTYIKERKAENKGGFYKIRPQETKTKAAEENTEDDVAFRQGDGPLTDREVVMESDVYSKVLGKPRYYGQKQRNYVARQRAKMAQKATELAEKLNTPIEVRETTEGLTGKKAKAKGWYDVKSGNIVVVVSNHGSIEDIQATVLHEVVAHKGLRQMFGEHFDTFLDNVYNNVDAGIRAEIDALTEKYGNTREATEEYLASLAENTYFEKVNPSLWSRIKQWFLNMLTEVGIKLDFELSDNELRYILWRSHQRLVNPGIYNPVTRITDVAVRARLGIGEYAPAVEEMSHVAEEDAAEMQERVMQGQTMFRIADDVITTVDDFNSTHKGAAPTVIIDSADTLEEQLRAEGFSKEDIAESLKDYDSEFAYYHPTYDKVVINDHDVPKDELIGYLWHENAHRAVRELYTREEMERLCDYIYKDDMPRVREVLSEMGYKPEELAEEAYVRGIEDVFSKKDYRRRLERGGLKPKEDATEEEKVIIDSVNRIVDFINNGREEERADGRRAGGGYAERSTQENRRGQDEEVRNSQETGENTQAGETRFRTVEEVVEQQEENEINLAKETVTSLGENLNSPVKIMDNIDSVPENRRKWKGWFDPETGEVVVVMPNHVSTEDAVQTVLHEIVAHKGLRAVLGEDFDGFLDGVYKNASPKVKRGINDKFLNALRNGPALTLREATEEYIAELAERDFGGYKDTWNAIRQWFRNFFRNFMNMEITDGELRYLLWKNYNRMKNGPMEAILDCAMEAKTGTGKVMARTAETYSVVDAYNKSVKGFKNKVKEGWYDEMRSLKKAQEAIEKELGREIMDSENVYLYANHIPSINKNKKEVFDNKYLRPFTSLLKQLYGKEVNGKKLDEKSLERYTNAKHGIERNREMSVKNALTEVQDGKKVFNEKAYKSWAQERDEVRGKNLPWPKEQRELDKVAEKYGANISDYSGLTAIFDTDKKLRYKKIADAAYQYVADVEKALGDDVNKLWGLLKGMTDYSLNEAFESGMMSKSTYEHIKQMYRYYVPLRGFTEETAEDFFDYVEGDHSPLNAVVKTAYGRKSEADNIFATILNMANSAIVQGSKNRLKQRLLNLAMRSQTGLLNVDNAWYAKNGDTFTPVEYPENVDEYADFEERMKELEKNGEVLRHRPGLEIGKKVAQKWNEIQHAVRVKRNGREYVVWVNGDPTMANAINGLLREEIGGTIKNVNQFRSKMVTQYSPTFVFTNLLRDVQSASIIYAVRRGTTMLKNFEKNVASNATDMLDLYLKHKKGTLDNNNPKERYFKEFLGNGGETGYTEMISIEEYEKQLKKLTKGLNIKNGTGRAFEAVVGAVDFANRCVENLCRFSAYQTSREAGISVLKSIEDAKEVSVNFNRKGSGAMGQKYAKAGFMFLNPAVQSIAQRILLTKKYPKKMAAVWAGEFILGAAMPVLYSIISAALGDDDDEITGNYYNLSDYRRRSSLCLPLKDGVFHIPLSHESRVLFGLGELCTSLVMGHEKPEDAPIEALNTLAQSLPLNPVEGWMPGKNFIETAVYNFMPDAAKPVAEAVMNRDFAGSTIHNRTDFNEFMPEYMRGKRGTFGVYKTISKYLTSTTDGYEKSFLNDTFGAVLNPSVMEHLLEGYLGGPYTFVEKVAKTGAWAFGNDEYAEFRNIPIASSFYTSLAKYENTPKEERTRRDWENAFRFYKDEVKAYDDKEKTAKNAMKYGEEGAYLTLEQMERNGEILMVDIFNDGNDRLKELYGASDAARKNGDFERVEEIDQQIYAEKRNIVSQMEQLANDPMIGYTFKRNKIEGPYGERETYGDVRDAKIINDIQKELEPIIEERKISADKNKYQKQLDLWRDLEKTENQISLKKSEMKAKPEKADESMAEIRELRAEVIELINNYRKDE